jgi:hypothetical protein
MDYRVTRDYYRVNKDCARKRNKASAGETISSTISKAAATLFSVTITVTRDCPHRQIQASLEEEVLVMIFELEETLCQ